jgi:hypothetical protein
MNHAVALVRAPNTFTHIPALANAHAVLNAGTSSLVAGIAFNLVWISFLINQNALIDTLEDH